MIPTNAIKVIKLMCPIRVHLFGLIPFNTTSISLLLPLPLESYSLFVLPGPFPLFPLLCLLFHAITAVPCPPLPRRQDRQGSGISMSVHYHFLQSTADSLTNSLQPGMSRMKSLALRP
jgi:hypothetical protein